jgi:plasmid stabilization system protein ParE
MKRYHVTPLAAQDLESIYEYVALDSLPGAGRLVRQLREAFQKLADQPGMGHVREDLTERPLRFWPVGTYLIVYLAESRPLQVVRILHGSRDIERLLREE